MLILMRLTEDYGNVFPLIYFLMCMIIETYFDPGSDGAEAMGGSRHISGPLKAVSP